MDRGGDGGVGFVDQSAGISTMESRSREPVVVVDREVDGRWIAEVEEIPGALSYGETREEAIRKVKELVTQVLADRNKER
jgi:predicted RNase H-like HicB family nuclease